MGWTVNATPQPLYIRERPGNHCTGGWVGFRADLDGCEKSRPPPGFRSPDRLAHSKSLYQLRYRGFPPSPPRPQLLLLGNNNLKTEIHPPFGFLSLIPFTLKAPKQFGKFVLSWKSSTVRTQSFLYLSDINAGLKTLHTHSE